MAVGKLLGGKPRGDENLQNSALGNFKFCSKHGVRIKLLSVQLGHEFFLACAQCVILSCNSSGVTGPFAEEVPDEEIGDCTPR